MAAAIILRNLEASPDPWSEPTVTTSKAHVKEGPVISFHFCISWPEPPVACNQRPLAMTSWLLPRLERGCRERQSDLEREASELCSPGFKSA